jgi:hypothetical protein
MICKRASKAEAILAVTLNGGDHCYQLSLLDTTFNSIHAFRCWTPFQVCLVINISSGKKHIISVVLSAQSC